MVLTGNYDQVSYLINDESLSQNLNRKVIRRDLMPDPILQLLFTLFQVHGCLVLSIIIVSQIYKDC